MARDDLQAQIEVLARKFAGQVTRLVANAIADEVDQAVHRVGGGEAPDETEAAPITRRGAGRRTARRAAPQKRAESVDRWVPDRRARRVPNFVIDATGLRTKKEIVERFGEHAIFEKGQPAPPPLRGREAE